MESSIINVAKLSRYVVNGSKKSSVHVCQLLNEAPEYVRGKTSNDHFTELQ